MKIHPTAVVDKSAELGEGVEVGPYAVVEGDVRIGTGSRLWPHSFVGRGTTLGPRCQVHPHALVGHEPQDVKFKGEPTYTEIGEDTIIRELATVHRGTAPGSRTVIGKRAYLMATSHVGHNCTLGDDVKVANGALLSGHVAVGDGVFVSGLCVVHQFVRIGELVMFQGGTKVTMDVPPFMMVTSTGPRSTNVIGMRRAGFSNDERAEIREAFKLLYRSELGFRAAIERVAELVRTPPGRRLLEFLRAPSKRGICGNRSTIGTTGEGFEGESDYE